METVTDLTWGVSKITADGNCSHEIKRHLLLGRKAMTNLDRILKSRDIISADKCPSNRSYGFSSSHVWMGELNYKESWVPKNWSFSFNISPCNEYLGLNFLSDGLVGSPCSPRDSKESTPTPEFKSINSLVLSLLYGSTLPSIHDYWKNHSLD